MKRFSFLFVFILCFDCLIFCENTFLAQTMVVKAQTESPYLRVTTQDTPLYANANGSNLICYLPYSYYVKIIEEVGIYTHVEIFGLDCPAIDGYTPTVMLSLTEGYTNNPFPTLTVTTEKNCVLYADSDLSASVQYLFAGRSLRYLGYYFDGQKEGLFLVGYNDKIGYVKESDVYPFTLPLHPNPLPVETPQEDEMATTTTNTTTIKYGIIICLVLAGVIALLIAFRSKKTSCVQKDVFYDENDYS